MGCGRILLCLIECGLARAAASPESSFGGIEKKSFSQRYLGWKIVLINVPFGDVYDLNGTPLNLVFL